MTGLNKINVETLEKVKGGKIVTVESGVVNYANLRLKPGFSGKIAGRVYNGTKLRASGRKILKDGCMWYEITLLDGGDNVWIAGSRIGL